MTTLTFRGKSIEKQSETGIIVNFMTTLTFRTDTHKVILTVELRKRKGVRRDIDLKPIRSYTELSITGELFEKRATR